MGLDSTPSRYRRIVEEHFTALYGSAFGRLGQVLAVDAAPDGRRAAVLGEIRSAWRDRPDAVLHLVDLDTGATTRLGDGGDVCPQWSPDGTRIAVATGGAARLVDPDTGAGTPAPPVPGVVEYLQWAPDGRQLLLGVHRPAATGGDAAPVVTGTGADEGARGLWIWDTATASVRQLTVTGAVWEASWCGADRIAAIVSDRPTENSWYTATLTLIEVAGGQRIGYRSDRQLALPTGAPDGSAVAFVECWCSDRGVVAGALKLLDPATGTVSDVDTRGVDVTDLRWPNSLWYAGIREPETAVGVVSGTGVDGDPARPAPASTEVAPAAGSRAGEEIWSGTDTIGQFYPAVAPLPGGRFVAVHSSYARPPELAVFDRAAEPRTVLAAGHDGEHRVRDRAGTLSYVDWSAPDGLRIGGFLARPAGTGPHPLVLHVHGGPVLAFRNRWQLGHPLIGLLVAHGYAVLSANPRGSTGRGREYVDRVVGDMGGADAGDLLAGVDAMIERGVTEPGRIGVTGHSYGGFMSCWLVGAHPGRFAAAVAASSVTDWYVQHFASEIGWFDVAFLGATPDTPGGPHFTRSPLSLAHRVRTPTLLFAGADDTGVPPVQSTEFATALAESGTPVEHVRYPNEGHVTRGQRAILDQHARTLDWFARHLPTG
ncbi:peptidase S9 [Actinocatenispora thailandica]|uniref:Peptidase S9 n=1 Tax=Actinocatenispora thailandica TaxID=227318 RepID=A0A7R7DTT4_9ACTN|nr:prolyl oligopeptidase family serine peptidase [Actinocatenispora thailandica]BCJ37645.1 peptidase S9 [Actinocatenispora thailandica]